jgi:pimeloyl-ACP methyl ester carboxylesterase
MAFADSKGTRTYYDDKGKGEPVLLCLTGWCVHHTIFAPLAERLSTQHRVLAMDWRGHGKSQTSDQDFGYGEMLTDILSVIQASGAQSVIPIAQAHGGWAAIALRRRLSERVPKMVCISWNPFFTSGNPVASQFLRARRALHDRGRWRETLEQMLTGWLSGAPASVERHIRTEMESHGFEDWARAGREIFAIYAQDGDPLQR